MPETAFAMQEGSVMTDRHVSVHCIASCICVYACACVCTCTCVYMSACTRACACISQYLHASAPAAPRLHQGQPVMRGGYDHQQVLKAIALAVLCMLCLPRALCSFLSKLVLVRLRRTSDACLRCTR